MGHGRNKRGSRRTGASSRAVEARGGLSPSAPAARASGDGAVEVVGLAELTDVGELAPVKALLKRGGAMGVLSYEQVRDVLAPLVGPDHVDDALSIFDVQRILVIGADRPAGGVTGPGRGETPESAPSRDPALGWLRRMEEVLLPAREVEGKAAKVAGAPTAPTADPALACLRRVGAVLHGADAAGPGASGGSPESAAATAEAADVAPGPESAPPVVAAVAPEIEIEVDAPEPAAAGSAAAPQAPRQDAPVPAAADGPAAVREEPGNAIPSRRSAEPARTAGREAEDRAQLPATFPERAQEVDVRQPAYRHRGHGPLRLREFALPALAILAFTAAMFGGVFVLTGDGAAGPSRPAPAASAGAQQQPAIRIPAAAPAVPAPSIEAVTSLPDHPAAPGLARALALAQANHEDQLNSTREGAQQAETEVLEAFRLGAAEIPGAWRILADVYSASSEWTPDTDGRASYRRKERDALSRALEQAPGDGEARYRYAMLLDDRNARLRELARAVRDNPNAIEPRRWLGEDLLITGKVDEGARLLVETAQLCNARELNVYGPTMATLLQNHGRGPDAAEVRARMQQRQ